MRRPAWTVTVAVLAVVVGGCSSSATMAPAQQPGLDHRRESQPPAPIVERPAATPYDAVTFQDPGVNPYVSTRTDNRSTFGLDVDTASYTVGSRFIGDGNLPDPASVRVEEWVNSFDQAYAPPEGDAFAIHVDGGPAPFLTGDESPHEILLRVGIKAREVTRRERPSAALTFVIDTSGSMAREDRIELVKRSLALLVDQLRADDRVAIVAFSTEARTILEPTTGADRDTILRAIDRLTPQQSTNVEAGLTLGYRLAREQYLEGGINRVVLASDGVANVGDTQPEQILQAVQSDAAVGIQLVSVGVGMGNYNDALLEALADQGAGFYAYVNTLDEARRLFVEDLTTTLDTVALDAKVQVEFDPSVVSAYRLIGYENRAIADNDFRANDVPAGAIGAGHAVTALYGLRLRDGLRHDERIATVSLRWTDPDTRRAQELATDVDVEDLAATWAATDPHFKLDALVAAAAEVFRGSPWIPGYTIADLARAGRALADQLPRADQVDQFLAMLDEAAQLER